MNKHIKIGFTLVELLVVISIIALLLAVLMPALSKARDMGRRIVCLGNLRTLSIAWVTYASDNKDWLVGGVVGVKNNIMPNADNNRQLWYAWQEIPSDAQGNYTGYDFSKLEYNDTPYEDKIRGIKKGLLYKYVGDIKPYHCSSDPRIKINPGKQPTLCSYTIAAGMNVVYPTYNSFNRVDNAVKTSQIKTPSQKYVFVENRDPRGFNGGFWDIDFSGGSKARAAWWNVVAGWHMGTSNWGFADGHAEINGWRDKRTIAICNETNYGNQYNMRLRCSIKNADLLWIVDRRMNKW